ncbi:DUF1036 domain-containing protein [Paenibacillus favisporus]|uniref:DUF1036 domain-containing protein n=2 Tax=Paenibacillus TaxID=44249 RepID=UPI003D28F9BF
MQSRDEGSQFECSADNGDNPERLNQEWHTISYWKSVHACWVKAGFNKVGCLPSQSVPYGYLQFGLFIFHLSMTLSKNSHRLIVQYRFFDQDGVDAMSFYVRNSTPNPVWVAVGYYDPDCSPITYTKAGWYRITPGRRMLLVTGSSVNQTYYFYAYDLFGNTWSGDFPTYVPSSAFNMCWIERCQGTGCREVGFDEVNVGNSQNYTLNLVEAAGAAKSRNMRAPKKSTRKFKLGKASLRKTPGKLGKLGKVRKPRYGKRK